MRRPNNHEYTNKVDTKTRKGTVLTKKSKRYKEVLLVKSTSEEETTISELLSLEKE